MSSNSNKFRVKPLAAAIGLAFAAPFMISSAFAVTQGNLPANGVVISGTATPSNYSVAGNFSTTTATIGATTVPTITVTGDTVIDWNATTTGATINPSTSFGGFNVGSNAALEFRNSSATDTATVLNVDTTGNTSNINGVMSASSVNVFVANANGIMVGNKAVISGPVIGLLGSDTTKFSSTGDLPVSFSGTNGTVTLESGANFTGTSNLIVAGSGIVNVSASNPNLLPANTEIVGGASGTIAPSSGAFSTARAPLSSAPTTVNLAIGSATNPIQQGTVSEVYANGDINNSGDLKVTNLYFTGTLSNTGILQTAAIEGTDGNQSPIYNNSTIASPMGNIMNSGTITTGVGSGFNVDIAGSFVNSGTISVGSTGATAATINVTAGSINNSGPINLITTTDTTQYPYAELYMSATSGSLTMGGTLNAPELSTVNLQASTMAGSSLNLNTTISSVNTYYANNVALAGFNVNVNAPVTSGLATNNGSINVTVGGMSGPQMGMLSIASAGTLNAVGTTNGSSLVSISNVKAPYNVSLAGDINGNNVTIGNANNVQGEGLITADNLTISAFGNVNNPNGGGNAVNGWLTNGLNVTPYSNGTAGTSNVTLTAKGDAIQMFNVAVKGNATYNTGTTSTFTAAGISNTNGYDGGFGTPAANAGSHLVVQASGNMTLLPESGTPLNVSGTNAFTFPGLIVADANGSLTAATTIDNGMYQNAPAGYGVFLQGSSINLSSPIYTNGNSWVNFSVQPSGIMPPIYGTQQITGDASKVNSYVKTSTVPGTNQSFTGYSMHIRKYTQFTAG